MQYNIRLRKPHLNALFWLLLLAAACVAMKIPLIRATASMKMHSQSVEPLAFADGPWSKYLMHSSINTLKADTPPLEFRDALHGLAHEIKTEGSLRFPGTGRTNYRVQEWVYSRISAAPVTGLMRGHPSERLDTMSFTAWRDGQKFAMLMNFSGRFLAYFCSAGSRHITVIVPLMPGRPKADWTTDGELFFNSFFSRGGKNGNIGISNTYGYGMILKRPLFFLNAASQALVALQHSTQFSYNGVHRILIGLCHKSISTSDWFRIRFDQTIDMNQFLALRSLQNGEVKHFMDGRVGVSALLCLISHNLHNNDMPSFHIRAASFASSKIKLVKVKYKAMKHLFNDLMTSKLPHAPALQQRKGVSAFLHWVGGGSEKWYKSPCAEHVRSIAKAAATPLADAWNSKKGRFRSMFMHAPPH